ncbi:vacuolar protein 14 C-terminal Fig4p binding-domain-containing protein [Fusarium tricinctum]|uniref:Vacuolar protein 14 C-terminal Fig4p binding-domain-containing protein n=1 Tax=Fusarium tricinctum TaxID=61284 RepID=A0A8K0RYW8_9HYPO|nr:vacuolar protein 14 C-terminal Fig4p binding-domain-containing protein [Fusarium tricinctum]
MDANIQRALNDRLYDKRKIGALEYVSPLTPSLLSAFEPHVDSFLCFDPHYGPNLGPGDLLLLPPLLQKLERVIRDLVNVKDYQRVHDILEQLCNEYAYAVHQPHARNGGLIGLAAAAIALGPELPRYLSKIVPPVLACFTDQDARVRYYACEAMYNIAKVAKGEILVYFNSIFDQLCKLGADSELSVKNGAELLDRLVKDIVSESAASYVSVLETPPEFDGDDKVSLGENSHLPTAFSLSRFIPLLKERIWVINPFTRQFLVGWITLLDSIPDLELVTYLPDFLGGLLKFLSDQNSDVRVATQTCLDKFLNEIKRIARIKKGILQSKRSKEGVKRKRQDSIDSESINPDFEEGDELDSDAALDDDDDSSGEDWIPGQDVEINYKEILQILTATLDSPLEEDCLLESLRWVVEFLDICPEEVLPFTPKILAHMLPAMASTKETIHKAATRVNTCLMDYVVSLSDDSELTQPHPAQPPQNFSTSRLPVPGEKGVDGNTSNRASLASSRDLDLRSPTPAQGRSLSTPVDINITQTQADLDYAAAVNSLTLLFLNDHEATRVAALTWLIMLHRKAPRKVLAFNDGTFPALLKTLSDPSDAVVTKDLQLLSQISRNSEDDYFANFMVNLLQLFSTDRKLLETRGNLIIRQLCLSLSPERIYRTLADCIEKEEDVEFASIMVQNLNNNLITAPQLADVRKRLRNLEARDGQTLFVALFRSWCYNAVATFSLCLLAQAYEQAYNLLQIFGELDMTVNMLIQVDKLVQLIESPVFTYLRLQLLEPEKYPFLYKCMYGILMLLPQSSAFAALKNRLNSVSAIGYLHVAPRTTSTSAPSSSNFDRPNRLKSREDGNIRWVELLEKFRSVQERARRAQRQNNMDGDEIPLMGVSELRSGDGAADVKGKDTRGVGLQTIPQKEPAPAPPVPAKRIGLGRQFGRLGGAVAGKGRRNQ